MDHLSLIQEGLKWRYTFRDCDVATAMLFIAHIYTWPEVKKLISPVGLVSVDQGLDIARGIGCS